MANKPNQFKPFSAKRKLTTADLHLLTNVLGSDNPDQGFKVTISHKGNEINLPLDKDGAQKLNDLVTNHITGASSDWEQGPCPVGVAHCVDFTNPVTGEKWHKTA